MSSPTCVRCGSPLPVVAADPTHPDWCAACATRALAPAGVAAPPPRPAAYAGPSAPAGVAGGVAAAFPPQVQVRTRPLEGLIIGAAGAGIAGAAWWGAAVLTELSSWHYLSLLAGLIVGVAVLIGARRGGLVAGLLALVLSVAMVAATAYFIDRSLTIAALEEAGRTSDIPLWQGWSFAKDVLQSWIENDVTRAAGWLLAPLAAVVVAGWPGRRPPFA